MLVLKGYSWKSYALHYLPETLKHSRGKNSSAQVHRAGMLTGQVPARLDQVYEKQVAQTHIFSTRGISIDYHGDLSGMVKEMRELQPFDRGELMLPTSTL